MGREFRQTTWVAIQHDNRTAHPVVTLCGIRGTVSVAYTITAG
ncbi:hypothetical protein ACIQFU_36470 [Streptomyces sp. NPDC093065]